MRLLIAFIVILMDMIKRFHRLEVVKMENVYIVTIDQKREEEKTERNENKKAMEWLKSEGFAYFVYFENYYMVYYIGFDSREKATKEYNRIAKKYLYGCVLSVNGVY